MTNHETNWPDVVRKIGRCGINASKIRRFMRMPLKSASIPALRKLGNSQSVSVPLLWGQTFQGVLPEAVSSVLWRYKCYEPGTTEFIISHLEQGNTFVDIGAHFGYFSLLASALVGANGKVISIEAMPSTFGMLKNNIDVNGLGNVELNNYAAYSKATTLHFKDFGIVHSSLNTAFSARGILEGQTANYTEVAIQALRGDDILAKHTPRDVAMIKIDAESSEEFVLEGLTETIAQHHPTILLELGGSNADDMKRLNAITEPLFAKGYSPRRWRAHTLTSAPELDGGLPYDNYIFVHPSRVRS